MKNIFNYIILFVLFTPQLCAQVGINTDTPEALLDIRALNPDEPENIVGLNIPHHDSIPDTNPSAEQQSMLIYLDDKNSNSSMRNHLYFWDNNKLQWDWIVDIITKDIDFNKSMVSCDRFYNAGGTAANLTGPGSNPANIRYLFFYANSVIPDERNVIENGRLRIGVSGTYLITLTGGIQKQHSGITNYRCDVLLNNVVCSNPPFASEVMLPSQKNRSGVFATSQVLELKGGDILSIQVRQITANNDLSGTISTYVNSPFTMIATLIKE